MKKEHVAIEPKKNANSISYDICNVCGIDMLFTRERIIRDTVPNSLRIYEVRYNNEEEKKPCEIASWLFVNYYGVLLSPVKLDLNLKYISERNYRELNYKKDWINTNKEKMKIEEFMR